MTQTREQKRAWYAKNKDRINKARRGLPDDKRETKRAYNRTAHASMTPSWFAYYSCEPAGFVREACRVTIERVSWEYPIAYYYVSRGEGRVGVFPGTESDEWIEYIHPDCLVERDGDLWWRRYDPVIDAFCYSQITKGSSCESPSTPTASR